MGIMNRSKFKRQLEKGLNTVFGEYNDRPEEWPILFEIQRATQAVEYDVLEVGLGVAPERQEGDPVVYDEGAEAWTARYVVKEFALAVAITQQMIEDGLYKSKGPKYVRDLAMAFKRTREIYHANVFNNASAAGYEGGDGVTLLSDAHPQYVGGTWSNKLAVSADASETALEQLLIQIRKAKDDRGNPIALNARRIITSPDQEYEWQRILKSPNRPGTADNDINAVMSLGRLKEGVHVLTRLLDPHKYFIQTDCPDGLKHFDKVKLQRGMMGDFETDNMRYKARERWVTGYTNPRAVYGSD